MPINVLIDLESIKKNNQNPNKNDKKLNNSGGISQNNKNNNFTSLNINSNN